MPPRPSTDTRLFALIDERWPLAPEASWVLIDTRGEVRERGRSAVTDWPAHDVLSVVLGASQSSWHCVRLPRGRSASDPKLLGFALEDCLLGNPDEHHLTVVRRQADKDSAGGTAAQILVTCRARLREVLAVLAANGRHPQHVYSELQCVPDCAGDWGTALRPGQALLQSADGAKLALDGSTRQIAMLLSAWMTTLAPTDAPHPTLSLLATEDARDAADSIAAGLPANIDIGRGDYTWWQTGAATNLLHGELARRSATGSVLRRLRLPLSIAATALLVLSGSLLADIVRMRTEVAAIEADIQARFTAAMPSTPMLLPETQLARRLEALQKAHGQIADDDLLRQLQTYAALDAGAPITRLHYDAGTLSLTLAADSNANLPDLQRALDANGDSGIELIAGESQ